MNDNIVPFRRKKPEKPNGSRPPADRPPRDLPAWLPFAGLVALAVAIYFIQRSGLLG
jgi:hypothetical protein